MKKSTALALAVATLTGAAIAQEAPVTSEALESVKAKAEATTAKAADAQNKAMQADAKAAEAEAAAKDAESKITAVSEKTDAVQGKVDGLEEDYLETKSTVAALAKIKVSGFIQARYEYGADTGIIDSKNPPLQGRFTVKRGRVSVGSEGTLGDFLVTTQYAEDGIKLIDAYGSAYDPWKVVKARMGVQTIPFGYEINASTPKMDNLERSLFEQSVFNGEKDLGAVLFLNYNEGAFQYIDFKAGVLNGNMNVVGIPVLGTAENGVSQAAFDDGKAYTGRLGFKAPIKDLNMEIDGGVSEYYAVYTSQNDTVFDFAGQLSNTSSTSHISTGNVRNDLHKQIAGADLQAYFNVLPIGGTVLRGEFYTGTNVSISGNKPFDPWSEALNTSNATGTDNSYVTSNKAYVKDVMGWYATLVQNFGKSFQGVVRFEQFDPNTDVSGAQIGNGKGNGGSLLNTSKDDIEWSMLEVGVNYFLSGNVKLSLDYDHKINETSANATGSSTITDYNGQIQNDKYTFQLQYMF
jgi:hypothetical protein